jgi:hypothetical protein
MTIDIGRLRLRCAIGALAAALCVIVPALAAGQSFNERPAAVTVTITRSDIHPGTFHLKEVARVCGEVPKDQNFSGKASFIVQLYPDSGEGEVTDVTFASNELVGGVTTSARFHLSVSVRSAAIGRPYPLVLDTEQPNMSGTATLTTVKGTQTLKIDGVNDRKEVIDLTLTCSPRATKG